ncbi:MAG TPA: 50S ribosomal protein L30 [Gammaproteobacteria bacterium]|mgnify:CR=1 FL=1|jgi:large subunit ribosomal protein L30|nr:50S ribosomal protein L30 [Gammaproteobacteria bacterium]
MAKDKTVKVTLKKSVIGRGRKQIACVKGLGLRRLHQTVDVLDTPANRGMINKISFMLAVEEGS